MLRDLGRPIHSPKRTSLDEEDKDKVDFRCDKADGKRSELDDKPVVYRILAIDFERMEKRAIDFDHTKPHAAGVENTATGTIDFENRETPVGVGVAVVRPVDRIVGNTIATVPPADGFACNKANTEPKL